MKQIDYCLFFLPILDWENTYERVDEFDAPLILKVCGTAIPTRPAPPAETLFAEYRWEEYCTLAQKHLQLTELQLELQKETFQRDVPIMLNHVSPETVLKHLRFIRIDDKLAA